jgi:hypothetical protein
MMCIHRVVHECRFMTCIDFCITCGYVLRDYRTD